jgi:glycerol-3-phosphate acyltransferase PlsY
LGEVKVALLPAVLIISIAGYLLGSINTAVIVSRLLYGEDIRRQGSGNAGMTNMLRVFGKKAAVLTTLGDLGKAILAVVLARLVLQLSPDRLFVDPGYITGLFVLVGHILPVFFEFKGGKGVMPALGVVLMVNPPAFLVLFAIAMPILLISRTMSVVSLVSAVLLPVVTLISGLIRLTVPVWETGLTLVYAVLVIVSHRENIRRLRQRKEHPLAGSTGKKTR